jgi:glycosyltransferase involved in cell wall biosynthesis
VHTLNIGGAELLAGRLATCLSDQVRSVFACLDDEGPLADELRAADHAVLHLRRAGGLDLGCARRLARWLAQEQVDVFHAHQTTPFVYSLLAGWGRARPPIVFTEHGRFYPDRASWKRRWLLRALLRKRDRLVAVGQSVRQALIDVERLPARRIEVIYNGCDLPDSLNAQSARREVRRELDIAESTCVVVMVARLDPIKDHALALAAFARLIDQIPDARLWIVGDGPQRAAIESLVREQGLQSRVTLLGQRRDVPRLLAAADVTLLTSQSEGIPLTVIEAMSAGLPVVATQVGGVPELVEHDAQGLLASHGDAITLAAHLYKLASRPDERDRLGAAGKLRAADFREERMTAAYAGVYHEVLAKA